MPLYEPKIAAREDLDIELAAPFGWTYAPGDTIIGNVVRKAHLITPHANLKLSLWGRTKTKITEQYGQNRYEYTAKWILLDAHWQQLFRGPLHVSGTGEKEDSWTVPFAVDIPTRPSESKLRCHVQPESYLPLDEASVALQMLPGSFANIRDAFYTPAHGIIEYHLEAILTYGYGGSTVSKRTTKAITLCHTSIEPPLTFYDLQRHSKTLKVCSQRLTPGMHDARLSFGQRTHKFFGSSKVPSFACAVDINVPKKVQMDSPLPIPFTIKITPFPNQISDSIRETTQTIEVHSIKLSLKATTDIRAPGWTSRHHPHCDSLTRKYDSLSLLDPENSPVVIPVGGKSDKGDGSSETLDLGSLLGLCLRSDGLHKGNPPMRSRPRIVYPDFVSYLMKHSNRLSWEVSLSLAGESEKVSSSLPFKVMSEYSRLL